MLIKKIISVALIGIATVSLAGCGSGGELSKAQLSDILKTASEKTADEKSYTAAMNVDFAFDDSGKTSEATVDTLINSVESPLNRHITINTKQNGQQASTSEFYVDTANDAKSVYLSYQDKWYKMNVDDDSLFSMLGQYDIKEVLKTLLSNSSNATVGSKEDINGTQCYKVDAVVPAALVPKTILSTGVFVVTGLVNLTEEHMSGVKDMPLTFWVNAKTGEVMKFSFDAGPVYQKIADNAYEALKGTKGYENAKNPSIKKYVITTEISDINNTKKTVLPKDVLAAQDITSEASGSGSQGSSSQSSASSSQQTSGQTENK